MEGVGIASPTPNKEERKEGMSRGRIGGWPKHKQHNELASLLGESKECSHPLALVAKQGKRTSKKKEPIHPSRLISTTTSWPKVGESHLKSAMQSFGST